MIMKMAAASLVLDGELAVYDQKLVSGSTRCSQSHRVRAFKRPTRISWLRHEIRLGPMEFRGEVPRNSAHWV
jgi:hypothetical protein